MTVTYTIVGYASRGKYVPTSESDALYVQLKSVGKLRLDSMNPGLPTDLYDWCHALMITHLYSANEQVGFKSYSVEGMSVSQDPGKTIFLIECEQIIADYKKTAAMPSYDEQADVTRADAVMPDFQLDQSDIPTFYSEVVL